MSWQKSSTANIGQNDADNNNNNNNNSDDERRTKRRKTTTDDDYSNLDQTNTEITANRSDTTRTTSTTSTSSSSIPALKPSGADDKSSSTAFSSTSLSNNNNNNNNNNNTDGILQSLVASAQANVSTCRAKLDTAVKQYESTNGALTTEEKLLLRRFKTEEIALEGVLELGGGNLTDPLIEFASARDTLKEALFSLQVVTSTTIENFRKGKDSERQFATIDDVFAYFPDLNGAALPAQERTLPATQWHIELPKFDSKERVNMLRASLPTSLHRSVQERVSLLRRELQFSHVVQAAVSGGGKTRTALELCNVEYTLYYDMNGGHAKIEQQDVVSFRDVCNQCVKAVPRDHAEVDADRAFVHAVDSLFVARLVVLAKLKLQHSITPMHWWRFQVLPACQDVLQKVYRRCEALSIASRDSLFGTLQDALKPVLGAWPPKVVLDEAQAMLGEDFNLWQSALSPPEKRSLATFVLRTLRARKMNAFVCGTKLSLANVQQLSSGVMAVQAKFDYLTEQSSSENVVDQTAEHPFVTIVDDGAFELLKHYLSALPDEMLREFALVLQGRPRFCAHFVSYFADNNGNGSNAKELFANYVNEMTYTGVAGSLLHNVKALISQPLARSALIRVCAEWRAHWQTKRFIVANRVDLQTLEVTLGMVLTGDKVALCEPLVIQAIIHALLRCGIDLASEIREQFRLEPDASVKGKFLELVVAHRLLTDSAAFVRHDRSLQASVRCVSEFSGVLNDIHLDEDRVQIVAFGTDNASNVIFMPSNLAGPDLFASPFVVSCKFSFDNSFSSAVISKAIRTTNPNRFYRKEKEDNKLIDHPHIGRDYKSGYALRLRHDAIVNIARDWPRIVRVRIEWVEGDNDTSTEPTVVSGDIWNDELEPHETSGRNDVLLLYRKNAAKKLLGFN